MRRITDVPNIHRLIRLRELLTQERTGRVELARRVASQFASEWLRERASRGEDRRCLVQLRNGHDVCWAEEDSPEPLVTVLIPTYNRGRVIVERAIESCLRQTYPNIEILVVGDHCDAPTEDAVRSLDDPRLRFVNLGHRGVYPESHKDLWLVAGAVPITVGHWLAKGEWIAACDDDDELTDDHVEVLLQAARLRRVEVIFSKAQMEIGPGTWREIGSEPLRHGEVSHGSVMYAARLGFMPFSTTSWRLLEATDWNYWRRLRDAGARIGYLDQVTYVHHLETPLRRLKDGSDDITDGRPPQ